MKILCGPDLHAKERAPRCRTDDYFQTFLGKLKWIMELADKEGVAVVVFPGDVFDSYRASDFLKSTLIGIFQDSWADVVVVSGQHDQRHHTLDLSNTPLGVLSAAGAVTVLGDWIFSRDKGDAGNKATHFYGASWGQEVPKRQYEEFFNVLATHRMIIKDNPLWEGQEDFSRAKNFLRASDFDLIISGDNHQFFMEEVGDRYLINCGSLMRSSISQVDHEPRVVLFDTDCREAKEFKVPIQPSEEVMDLEQVEKQKEKNEKLGEFIDSLAEDAEYGGLNFAQNLAEHIKKNDIPKEVQDVIWEAVGEGESR